MKLRNYAATGATVAALVGALRLAGVSTSGVAAPLLLLDVVLVARLWGIGPALFGAASAAACYSYYFLPPMGFGIDDPDDWVAFITFIVTAVVAGELASRAERRAAEAQQGRREIERLYQELEAAFDRASEAEAARRNEQLKATLLDALTHNLRTPLTAIKAAVTAIIRVQGWGQPGGLTNEGQRELLEVIDEESDRLNRFIEGLSTGATDSTLPLNLRAVLFEDVLRAGLGRAEALTRDHQVVVQAEGMPALSVDAPSVAEVLYILLDNASKYSPIGATIRLTAGVEDERYVRVAVTDEGPGIAPDLREKVFEKFFRIPSRQTSDPRRVGIGLGLPIARRLVETQGGRIWIETPPSGRGTTVAMTLPVATDVGEAGRPAAAAVAVE